MRALTLDPVEAGFNAWDRVAERGERRAKRQVGDGAFMPWPPCPYDVDESWEESLHRHLGAPWPCPATSEFWDLWAQLTASFAAKDVRLGRGQFGGWGDGEPGVTRAAWCGALHSKPDAVLETGVARGITTRFILEALQRNGAGHLWSIDVPPIFAPDLHSQIGAAVPDRLRDRWTYVRGSSRRRMRGLLAKLGQIDMFVHDSRHSARNLEFELSHAWSALAPGGLIVVDDIDLNCFFHAFTATRHEDRSFACWAEPTAPDPGRQDDRGVFGVLLRQPRARAS